MTNKVSFTFTKTTFGFIPKNKTTLNGKVVDFLPQQARQGMTAIFAKLKSQNEALYQRIYNLKKFTLELSPISGSPNYTVQLISPKLIVNFELKPETSQALIGSLKVPSRPIISLFSIASLPSISSDDQNIPANPPVASSLSPKVEGLPKTLPSAEKKVSFQEPDDEPAPSPESLGETTSAPANSLVIDNEPIPSSEIPEETTLPVPKPLVIDDDFFTDVPEAAFKRSSLPVKTADDSESDSDKFVDAKEGILQPVEVPPLSHSDDSSSENDIFVDAEEGPSPLPVPVLPNPPAAKIEPKELGFDAKEEVQYVPPRKTEREIAFENLANYFKVIFPDTKLNDGTFFGEYFFNHILPIGDIDETKPLIFISETGEFTIHFKTEKQLELKKLPEGKSPQVVEQMKKSIGTTLHVNKVFKGRVNHHDASIEFDEGMLTMTGTKWRIPFRAHLRKISAYPDPKNEYPNNLNIVVDVRSKIMNRNETDTQLAQDFVDLIACNSPPKQV